MCLAVRRRLAAFDVIACRHRTGVMCAAFSTNVGYAALSMLAAVRRRVAAEGIEIRSLSAGDMLAMLVAHVHHALAS